MLVLLLFAGLGLSQEVQQTSVQSRFIENKGQVHDQNFASRPDVLFSGYAGQMTFHLRTNGVSYQTTQVTKWHEEDGHQFPSGQHSYRTDINWLGTNQHFTIDKGPALAGHANYFTAGQSDGILGVRSFHNITYKDLYPGIDLKWYFRDSTLEYDFIVKPGTDYRQIRWEISGADEIKIDEEGRLVIQTPQGKIQEDAPIAYQLGSKLAINWRLEGNVVGFDITDYNSAYPMTIDPMVRVWGTYFGGPSDDHIWASCSDPAHNTYFSGGTSSLSSIATTGAHQTTLSGNSDAMLVKFDPSGQLLWATYYGGPIDDWALACTIDDIGNVYIGGATYSDSGIATTSAHQTARAGFADGLLAKFSGSGLLQWATYYGGTSSESIWDMATDDLNFVYIVGGTSSNFGIATAGSHQGIYLGYGDAYIAKFDPNGTNIWGTYYGGSGNDHATGISFTDSGTEFYVSGSTKSSSGIATIGAHQPNFSGNALKDGFLAKFDIHGVRQWATYYGGNDRDEGESCTAVGNSGVYLVGNTSSSNNISTPGGHQTVFGGYQDAFIAKFNSIGVREWASYYGGSGAEYGRACSVTGNGKVFLVGYSTSNAMIASTGAYQTTLNGNSDAFLAYFDGLGVRQWATYYGGSGEEESFHAHSITPAVYLIGGTTSMNNISTSGSFQPNYGGGTGDAFVVKFNFCSNDSVIVVDSACGFFISPSKKYTWNTSGTYIDTLINKDGCDSILTIQLTVEPGPTLLSTTPGFVCDSGIATISATSSTGTINWYSAPTGGVVLGSGTSFTTPVVTSNTMYHVNVSNGTCSTPRIGVPVTVNPKPQITNTTPGIRCGNGPVTLSATPSGGTIKWYANASGGLSLGNGSPFQTSYLFSSTTLFVEADSAGCISERVPVDATIIPLGGTAYQDTFCTSYTSPTGKYIWTTAGLHRDTMTGPNGCDSIISVTLVDQVVNTMVNVAVKTITAVAASATYQWLDCEDSLRPIAGQTSRSFTPASNGQFAVVVTEGGCTDTSECIEVTVTTGPGDPTNIQIINSESIKLFPNPTTGTIHFTGAVIGMDYTILDAQGKLMCQGKLDDHMIIDITRFSKGLYVIRMSTENSDPINFNFIKK